MQSIADLIVPIAPAVISLGGFIDVRDAEGGIGTPTSDHERTKMDLGTRHILVIINGYSGAEGLSEAASMTIELLQRYASATDCQSWMF